MDDDTVGVDMRDTLDRVRSALPDNDNLLAVFDIVTQQGEISDWFCEVYGGDHTYNNDLSRFLGISLHNVQRHREKIKVYCMYYGLDQLRPGSLPRF